VHERENEYAIFYSLETHRSIAFTEQTETPFPRCQKPQLAQHVIKQNSIPFPITLQQDSHPSCFSYLHATPSSHAKIPNITQTLAT